MSAHGLQHGVILLIHEINAEPSAFSSVRTFGSLSSLDTSNGRAVIKYREGSLVVDVCLLGTSAPLKIGSLYMFIGELQHQNHVSPCVGRNTVSAA